MPQLIDNRISSLRTAFQLQGPGGDLIAGLDYGLTINPATGAASIVPPQNVTLTASAANYVEIIPGNAVATANIVGFTPGSLQLYILDTTANDIRHVFDARQGQGLAGAVGDGGSGILNAAGNITGPVTANRALGTTYSATLTGNVTFTFTNPSASGVEQRWTFYLTQDGTGTRLVTWPASVKWGAALAPTLSIAAAKTDRITLLSTDGGATWLGSYNLGY